VIFYLGAPEPVWLERLDVPLFVSRNRLLRAVGKFPRARVPWAMDSGGFTEVTMCGGWRVSARDFAREVNFFSTEIGGLDWAAPQDWMCEDIALAKTGRGVAEHQRLTLENLIELRTIAAWIHWVPVLQGRTIEDYLRHADAYERAGIDLARESRVGVGSICRRQSGVEAATILRVLARRGLRLHGFGLSTLGLRQVCDEVASADSMAWSRVARERAKQGEAPASARNDPAFALAWRDRLLASLPTGCVQDHPAAADDYARFRWLQGLGRVPRDARRRGALPPRELDRLLRAAAEVVRINDTLDEEEAVEVPRGSMFGSQMLEPLTYRTVLAPDIRTRLLALSDADRARLPLYAWDIAARALAMTDPGPLMIDLRTACGVTGGPAPCARPVTVTSSGRTYCPERCTPSDAAHLLAARSREKRAGGQMVSNSRGGCTPGEAGYALRWGIRAHQKQ
jgi:hypothetical protein